MKIKMITAFAVAIVFVFIVNDNLLMSRSTGAPGGNTGAPGQFGGRTCATTGCHSGSAIVQTNLITSNIPIGGYVPGQSYTIIASITEAGRIKYGFEVSAQNTIGNFLGTFSLVNPTTTKFTNSNGSITHTSAGNAHAGGTATWTFNWTAPLSGTGDVTFYGAFNASNNNNNSSGDIIYRSTLLVQEDISIGIDDEIETTGISMYPNPATEFVNIDLGANNYETINLFDLSGKLISSKKISYSAEKINTANLNNGIYFVQIKSTDKSYNRKLMVKH